MCSHEMIESLESRVHLSTAMGMNVERPTDYNPGYMFTDAFLSSRSWISYGYNTVTGAQTFGDGGAIHVDQYGWPTSLNEYLNASGQLIRQRLATQMFTNLGGHYPAGVYTVEWKGTGTLTFTGDGAASIAQPDLANGAHRRQLTVNPANAGVALRIDTMSAADPIRGIRVWMPDYNGQSFVGQRWSPGASFSPFHPLFKERLDPFSTIRFMNMQEVIPSQIVNWSDRRSVDAARQVGYAADFRNGMAPEYMIELANELGSNAWFCMPHLGADDFVRNFAQLVHDTLAPGLKVYVEWSNEVWNPTPGYEGHEWIMQQLTLPENAGKTMYDLWAAEMRRDFDIWSDVFSDDPTRLVRVVAGQAANIYVATQLLARMEGKFDAVASDGYLTFNQVQLQQFNASTTVDDVYAALYAQSLPDTLQFISNHKALADQYSLSLGRPIQVVNYEGGLLLFGNGRPYEAPFLAAGRDPRVYTLYSDFLREASTRGLDLFTAFVFTDIAPQADASHLRWLDQPISEAHKYRALLDAVSGELFTPEFSVTAVSNADEQGPRVGTFEVTRTGDADRVVSVAIGLSGTSTAGDYVPVASPITFAAGERSKLVSIVPIDDALNEGDETVVLTLLPAAGYRVRSAAASATVALRDNDNRLTWSVPIANPSFEVGGLAGWTLTPSSGNYSTASSAITDPNAPTAAQHGTTFVWGGGAAGNLGGGALAAGVLQRIDVSSRAALIDAGTSTATFRGWGAGSGPGQQSAYLEIAFYNALAGGTQLGSTTVSNVANSLRSWTELVATAAIPAGARSVELRAFTQRPTGYYSNRAGLDNFSGVIESPLPPPPTVTSWSVNDGATQRSMVRKVTVTFSETVTIAAGALAVRLSSGAVVPNTAVASADGKTYDLTFPGAVGGSLADGVYDLVVAGSGVQGLFGNAMAGNYTQRFHRLFGDNNGDRKVNMLDYARLRLTLSRSSGDGLFNTAFDFDGSDSVNLLDLTQFRRRFGARVVY